ncbi:MAG TPA: serine hydrolase [Thermoanaerobaculia bacterium]|nr:serine hydrolase [Thermoanaerobaculia bacterium]
MRKGVRRGTRFFALFSLLPLFACASAAPSTAALERRLDEVLAGAGGTVAVAYYDLGTGATVLRDARLSLHAASTMKVPVMLALFREVDRGALRRDQPVPVKNEFASIADGSAFALDPAEDGDPELYEALGDTRPLEELMRRMIVRSSNLATNLLIELARPERVMELMRTLGARDIRVLRGVEDEKAYEAGLNNTTTAYDLMLVLRAIAERRAVTPAASEAMLAILAAQEFKEKIPAGLPAGVAVANKTGDITGIHHDAAIVLPAGEPPYVLVVLTKGFADEAAANTLIAAVSRAVWEARRLQ